MIPATWKHKETGKTVRALPWWECFDELLGRQELTMPLMPDDTWPDRKYKIGALVQIGWLLENEHGCWMGFGPKAIESFEVIE